MSVDVSNYATPFCLGKIARLYSGISALSILFGFLLTYSYFPIMLGEGGRGEKIHGERKYGAQNQKYSVVSSIVASS